MFDVVISGAGPAGSRCAQVLAEQGYNVALIERDSNWRKPCGGAVSSRIFKYYPQLRKLDYPPITGVTIYSGDYHKLQYSWKNIRDYSINVDRLEFDNLLRKFAVDAGANLFDKNLSLDFITKNKRKIGIKTKTPSGIKEYRGKILIVADGMSSRLAPKSGLRGKWQIGEIGLCKCAIMKGENNLDKSAISMFFRAYKGYGWIFPIDDKRFNIGCGTWLDENLNTNLNQAYSEFLNDPHIKKFFPKSHYEEIWSAAYPIPALGVKEKCLYGDNVLIVGDAAGFVSPISGEGIHPSVVSGNAAAEIASEALKHDDFSNQRLKKYKQYPNIKKIIRNFKMKVSMVEFLFENKGLNLSKMFELAETEESIREEVINMFLFNIPPSKELLLRIKS
ncbi:MAG: NAD(P)/FAD-dependent oxidoreductase [Candidatus Lokiarchaeota archaeon]|jgi:digeranylgeranylglycerophospholipid reductase|nr:NAD(P)/FAD-dependent oxidoreductase [Candidatus Lokiarchaeota archaeon]